MKATGIVRRIDNLGRFVLPKELRDTMGIPEGTPLSLFVDGEDIVLRKYGRSCMFCGGGTTCSTFMTARSARNAPASLRPG